MSEVFIIFCFVDPSTEKGNTHPSEDLLPRTPQNSGFAFADSPLLFNSTLELVSILVNQEAACIFMWRDLCLLVLHIMFTLYTSINSKYLQHQQQNNNNSILTMFPTMVPRDLILMYILIPILPKTTDL